MAGILQSPVTPGQEVGARWANDVTQQSRLNRVTTGGDMRGFQTSGGTALTTRRRRNPKPPTVLNPFQIYLRQDPAATSWVYQYVVHTGTVNAVTPQFDDSFTPLPNQTPPPTDPTTLVVVPPGTVGWIVWLESTVNVGNGQLNDDWLIKSSATGWTVADGASADFPHQPRASAGTAAPPNVYIFLGSITTGSATVGDQTYSQYAINQMIQTSLACWQSVVSGTVNPSQGGFYPIYQFITSRT